MIIFKGIKMNKRFEIIIPKNKFEEYKDEIAQANLKSMFAISVIGAAFFAVLTILSLPFIGVLNLFSSYFALFILFLLILILSNTFLKTHHHMILPIFYIIISVLDLIAIYMGTYLGTTTNATTFLLFLLLIPLFILDYPWRISVVNGIFAIIFIVIDCYVKNSGDILSLDVSNVIIVYFVGIAFIQITVKRNLQIFEKKRSEEAEINEKNLLINSLPVGIAVFEVRDGVTSQIFTNEEFFRLFEDTREARLKRTGGDFFNSIHPDDRAKLKMAIQSVIDGKNFVTQPCRSQKGNGSYIWVRFSSSVARRMDNYLLVYSTYSSMEDEMKSRQATQAKTDFLSRVSHDMRTPLNGILGLTELLKEKTIDESNLQDLQQLEMSGKYLLNLINDTLDVSRIESGRLELNPVVCDGRDVFNNVIALIKPNLMAKHLELTVHADNIPFTTLYTDVGRVEQIIMNILGNAVKFTPEGGKIEYFMDNISIEDGVITDRIIIKDSGIGMSKEFLPRLFEPFSQENNTMTNSFQGTGLGMTITKQIIEVMGGNITVESELGKGTTFTIILPFTIATEEQISEWKKTEKIALNDRVLEGKRVLLFEDHPLNASIAERILKKKGMLVDHAENGQIGVDMFRESEINSYDIILMDIRMPVMDGLEAARTIRNLDRPDALNIPIVAMTANAFDDDVKRAMEAGMNAHLGKPIDTDKLFETLEKMLHLSRTYIKQTILIVDDIEANRAALKMTLQDEYTVIEADSGVKALEILQTNREIDAVITDIQMPEMSGVELIEQIRKETKYKHIVIIANTQYGDHAQEEQLIAAGADDFVYKPVSPMLVELRIKNALKK